MLRRLIWMARADRLGPDLPLTHFLLHFPYIMRKLGRSKFAHFGDNAIVRPFSYAVCTSNISLGKNVVIRPGTMLFAGETPEGTITIEDDCLLGSGIHMYCDNHEFSSVSVPISLQGFRPTAPILVKSGAWIGANAILLPGVVVGKNSVIGAGSVVNKSIPDFSVAAGNPCKVIRTLHADV